jgi:hypothetical protein
MFWRRVGVVLMVSLVGVCWSCSITMFVVCVELVGLCGSVDGAGGFLLCDRTGLVPILSSF